MKRKNYILRSLALGSMIAIPSYLALILLIKLLGSLRQLMAPISHLLPEGTIASGLVALLIFASICFLLGVMAQTVIGRKTQGVMERSVLELIPGYMLFRGLSRQIAGDKHEKSWKAVLAEFDDGLVPAFVIEELEDGRYTVFVPSAPTPLAGSVYILEASRVHFVDVPFTEALRVSSHWGQGAKELVKSIKEGSSLPNENEAEKQKSLSERIGN